MLLSSLVFIVSKEKRRLLFLQTSGHVLRLIHMYPSDASEQTAVCKEPLFVDEHWFVMIFFIREALIQVNIGMHPYRSRNV